MLRASRMTKLITVFGSTGNQGGSVVRAIIDHPELSKEWKVRGITRNPNKPDAQALIAKGVEMVAVRPLSSPYMWLLTSTGRSQQQRFHSRSNSRLDCRLRCNKLLGESLSRMGSPTRSQSRRRCQRSRRVPPHLVFSSLRVQNHSRQATQPAPL